MRLWTWLEMKTKIENDLDLQGEEIVTPQELLDYANEAIDEAEAVIHNLNEDYFFTKGDLGLYDAGTGIYTPGLVAGVSSYDKPVDIYASKIRSLQFDDGVSRYPVKRVKNLDTLSSVQTGDRHQWLSVNAAGQAKVEIFPAAQASGNFIKVYYLRNAARLFDDTSVCDIPEFVTFVINFVKAKIAVKELHPRLDYFMSELERVREQMALTLTEMVPDGDNEITPDMTSYDEQSI